VDNLSSATSNVLSFQASRQAGKPWREDLSGAGVRCFRALLWGFVFETVIIIPCAVLCWMLIRHG
jgi:hypothetical protein